ncbi:MAG TPA: hypothetical protein VNZ25_08945, partial [Candidatus Angelobacter sp.]|nr:hypothetical protein [Candidatus Angelobacter sp.]
MWPRIFNPGRAALLRRRRCGSNALPLEWLRFFLNRSKLWRLWLLLMLLPALNSLAADETYHVRLDTGWAYHQGTLGSVWEIWRGDKASDNVAWSPVTLPHCFNARDAVDPDVHYYQGQGWYRTRLKLANPYPAGRTLLHFDGAGQQSRVFV